jgi:hypothetical protein
MKQTVVLQILLVVLVLHDFMYMPLETSMLTFLGAFALYGLTGQLFVPVLVLFLAPLIVMSVKLYKQSEGFAGSPKTAEDVSERVKGLKKHEEKHADGPTGVLENPEIENFQTLDASGNNAPGNHTADASSVSVPSYVQGKGRLLVVPEQSVAPANSVDRNPQANPALITGPDSSSVNAALSPDATQLPHALSGSDANSMSVGPTLM